MAQNGRKGAEQIWMEKLEQGQTVSEKEAKVELKTSFITYATLEACKKDGDDDFSPQKGKTQLRCKSQPISYYQEN